MGRIATPAIRRNDRAALEQTLAAFAASRNVINASIIDTSGRPLADYHRAAQTGAAQSGSAQSGSAQPGSEGQARLVTRSEIKDGAATIGELVVIDVARDWTSILPRYMALTGALLFGAAGTALLVGRWLARRVVDPISKLSDVMRAVAASGRFDVRAPRLVDDEIGRLTDAFNSLLDQLARNDAALRQTFDELVAARDAAEDANRMKSDFLANMSHEIRTPLNGVLAMAEVMAADDLHADQRERLDVIRRSGEALLDVLNDILDMAKIEAGRLTLDSAPFDPSQVAEEAVAAFAPMAAARRLALELEIDPFVRGVRQGDAARLRQILNNLISNGLKFTSAGSVKVAMNMEGEALHLVVSDTGMGVPPEKLPLLFQKFIQLDSSSTRRFGGAGLGLAISSDLCNLMGGKIWAEQDRPVGAAFHVLIPLPLIEGAAPVVETEAAATPPSAPPASLIIPQSLAPAPLTPAPVVAEIAPPITPPVEEPQGEPEAERTLRILAAEDNTTNRLVLEAMIGILGYDMDLVCDGRAAVNAFEIGHYDVILMDIQMPELDGIGATREIRAMEQATGRMRTPIIAVSANAMNHQVSDYLAVGMDAHVPKPIELARLHSAILTAMGVDLEQSPDNGDTPHVAGSSAA